MFLKSSVSLKQEIKYNRIIDFIRILYTVKSNAERLESIKNDLIEKAKYGLTRYEFDFITFDEKEVENYKKFFKKLDLDVSTHCSSKVDHRYMLMISW